MLDAINDVLRRGGVVAGSSAGAAVMSKVMLTGEEKRPDRDSSFTKIEADNIITQEGFGFLEDVIVLHGLPPGLIIGELEAELLARKSLLFWLQLFDFGAIRYDICPRQRQLYFEALSSVHFGEGILIYGPIKDLLVFCDWFRLAATHLIII
jgi:hypothetical protein